MPVSESQAERIAELKNKAVEYFKEVPVIKYAAMYVGRDEDTLLRWIQADSDFADRLQESRSEFVKKKMKGVKPDFALERLEKEIFSERVEHTGAGGGPVQIENATEAVDQAKVFILENKELVKQWLAEGEEG